MRHTLVPLLLCAAALLSACVPYDDAYDDLGFEDEDGSEEAGPADGADACSPDELGGDDDLRLATVHRVVDGELGPLCWGEADATTDAVWETLATLVPVEQLRPLTLFGSYRDRSGGDDVTLAYVVALDDLGDSFLMAFDRDESGADPDELLLTVVHEYFHVLTGTSQQLDRTVPVGACDGTYDNGEGCYLPDAYVQRWIETFWPADVLADVDVEREPDVADGEERCELDAGFLGPYAATNPEEDIAESFSAFVLDVAPATGAQAERVAWFEAYPELTALRDRARAAELGPLPNTFERCG